MWSTILYKIHYFLLIQLVIFVLDSDIFLFMSCSSKSPNKGSATCFKNETGFSHNHFSEQQSLSILYTLIKLYLTHSVIYSLKRTIKIFWCTHEIMQSLSSEKTLLSLALMPQCFHSYILLSINSFHHHLYCPAVSPLLYSARYQFLSSQVIDPSQVIWKFHIDKILYVPFTSAFFSHKNPFSDLLTL